MGGGIFALRRPRPYSRHLRGWHCDPNAGHCRLHARTMPHVETCGFKTTRHAASLRSSRNGVARLKPSYPHEEASPHKRLNHTGFFRGSPFGIRRFKTYSLRSSKDVATRRAASLSSSAPFPFMPTWAQMMVDGNPPQRYPRNADCRGGVFATRRFPHPSPTRRHTRKPNMGTYGL